MVKRFLMLFAITLWATAAYAVTVTINMDWLYDWGRGYTVDQNGQIVAENTNPYYHFHPGVNVLGTYDDGAWDGFNNGYGDGKEDAYAIMRVTSITGFYNVATDNYELTAFFYGLDHIWAANDPTTGIQTHFGTGGYVDVYKHASTNYGINPPSVLDRSGNTTFPKITDGELVLRLKGAVFGKRYIPQLGRDLEFTYMGYSVGVSAHSDMYFDVVGGAWAPYFDTNKVESPYGAAYSGADFAFTFASTSAPVFKDGDLSDPTDKGWTWTLHDGTVTGSGDLVPEPASMVLLGFGLIGLGFVRRKKR